MAEKSASDGGLAGRSSGGKMADVRTKFKVDAEGMNKVVTGFKAIRTDVEWLKKNLDGVITQVSDLAKALGDAGQASSGLGAGLSKATTTTANQISTVNKAGTTKVQAQGTATPDGAPASGKFQNFMGKAGGYMAAADSVMKVVGGSIAAIDNRIDSAYGEMLANDRLSVLFQQTMGISQRQYIDKLRRPLVGQRLGEGGMNALLGLQAQTGLLASNQASSVSALRAATGYMYSAQDITQAMATMANPAVNNRLTMTLGTGMYGIGGGQRPMLKVFQDIVQGAGLTKESVVKGAMQIGSVTRARLSAYGLPEDMQNMLLQYAQANINYKKKGGSGMYDPSRDADRRRMGIEDNFATQFEETQRTSQERNENFYSRQVDNYAKLEEQTQRLIKVFGALEDKLSGLIGARLNQRNNPLWNIGKKVLGGAAIIGGLATNIFAGWTGAGAIAGTAMMGVGANMAFGDPPLGRSRSTRPSGTVKPTTKPTTGTYSTPDPQVPIGFSLAKAYPLSQLNKWSSFGNMDPTMQARVSNLLKDALASGIHVGVGTGYRTNSKEQFLKRYQPATAGEDADWTFEGKPYKLKAGAVPYAPPGQSMHEAGFAIDMFGETARLAEFIDKNPQYGLRHFRDENGEDWHLQPTELPDSFAGLGIFGQVEGYSKTGMEQYESFKSKNPASSTYQSPFVKEAFASGVSPHGTQITSAGGTSSSPSKRRVTTSGSSYMTSGQSSNQPLTTQLKKIPIYSQMNYRDQMRMMSIGDPQPYSFTTPYPMVGTTTTGGDINISVSPTFHITSSGSTDTDGKRVAQEMVKVIEREMKLAMMRKS